MRLWFKIWCETRVRFALAAAAVAITTQTSSGEAPATVFLVLATILGGGTLRQEREARTLGFTLALPVSRERHIITRAVIGLGELVALAGLAAIITRTPAVLPAWTACGALALVGALGFAMAIANEYAAWLAAFGALMTYEVALGMGVFPGAPDLYGVMLELDLAAALLVGGFALAGLALLGALQRSVQP